MTDADWDLVHLVHVFGIITLVGRWLICLGAYKVTKAAWPYFQKQKYGRYGIPRQVGYHHVVASSTLRLRLESTETMDRPTIPRVRLWGFSMTIILFSKARIARIFHDPFP